jgi:tyrosyl-tRNA synthetase
MSVPDGVMRQYYELLTDYAMDEIDVLVSDATHPRDAKVALAARLVTMYHGEDAAREAAAEFDRVFRKGKLPEDIPEKTVPADVMSDGRAPVIELLRSLELVSSNSEARRMVQQGAVSIDGDKVTDIDAAVEVDDGTVVQVGKRRFASVKLG